MYEFQLDDPGAILGGATSIHFNLARALKLMAYATAPSPGSRYQPGSSWSVAKYATAVEPRLSASSQQIAIANAGIWDLDPHQKTVLADDMGMGLALAALDTTYGIDGLWDCYSLWLEELLRLRHGGRHRRMPDFLVLLRRPIAGSKMALLECKGSTRSTAANAQLTSACRQLTNVTSVLGVTREKHHLPQVGIACMLHPGTPVVITVADPPEELYLPNDIEMRLRANYVALELAAFGDIGAADSVRAHYALPSWGRLGFENSALPRSESLRIDQSILSVLPKSARLSPKAREVMEPSLIEKICLTRAQLVVGPSLRSTALSRNAHNESALILESVVKQPQSALEPTGYDMSSDGARHRRQESDVAEDGSTSRLSVEIWAAGVQ